MLTVIVTACAAFVLTVSVAKTVIMCLQTKYTGGCRSRSLQLARYTNKRSNVCAWAGLLAQIESSGSTQHGVFRGPGRAYSGTRWKTETARVCSFGSRCR